MPLIPFATKTSDTFEGREFSGERLLNLFVDVLDGVSPAQLKGSGGLKPFVGVGGVVRAMATMDGILYAVSDGTLWKIENGIKYNVGTIKNGETSIAASSTEIAIVVSDTYYIFDGSNTQAYTTGAVDAPKSVAFQDGYFIVSGQTSARKDGFTVSSINNGKTFNALDFAAAENASDELQGVVADHGRLLLVGTNTIETWYNSGASDFPYARLSGATAETGCLNGKTIAKADNGVFWLGSDNVVYRSNGTNPEAISTRQIETIIKNSVADVGFIVSDAGHKFYCLRLEGKPSLFFDITTGLWSERGRGDNEWAAKCSVIHNGIYYFGCNDGNISTIDRNTYTDNGKEVLAEAISLPIQKGSTMFPVNMIFLSMRTGAVDIGREPQIMLQTTKNGRQYGREQWRGLGLLGNINRQVRFNAQGSFQRFQVRLRITDPVPRNIYGVEYG